MSEESDLERKMVDELPLILEQNDVFSSQDSLFQHTPMDEDSKLADIDSLNESTRTVIKLNVNNVGIVEEKANNKQEEKPSRDHHYPRVPGNRRNRFKKFLQEGMTREKAYEECMKGYTRHANETPKQNQASTGKSEKQKNNKRNRSNPSLSIEQDAKKAKQHSNSANVPPRTGGNFRDALAATRIGIIPTDFPRRALTREEMENIRGNILELVTGQTGEAAIKPRFTQLPSFRSGWIVVYCANDETADWILSQNNWREVGCKAIPVSEFPKENVLVGRCKYCERLKTDFIVKMIAGQNKLQTYRWRVMHRHDAGNLATLTLEVDEDSLLALRQLSFIVHYGFGLETKLRMVRNQSNRRLPNDEGEGAEKMGGVEGGA